MLRNLAGKTVWISPIVHLTALHVHFAQDPDRITRPMGMRGLPTEDGHIS